ncbi:MAG: benzoyl-CoA 2,3-epoxidase subunit BoxA [Burkholderiaceae bacterium]|jgi:benzoyl-CoA 2,3-epoxidase subunit A|nr:benzoyl-CoA 2,3-epoxidase subunit BoxA [Burkholderiaceae bacterium]
MSTDTAELLQQHLIDPEVCIRCNTCEATCPVGAVTHDSRNYVVDADKCNHCMACVPPCPTGSIDHWLPVLRSKAYTVAEQLTWDELPAPQSDLQLQGEAAAPLASPEVNVPPRSAAQPAINLYGPKSPISAKVVGNMQVNEPGTDNETHHIVLDFGSLPFPVLEGQSVGIIPPGVDAHGKPHHARQYSIASPRNGERPGYNNLSLTVKRVVQDHQGQAVKGVASNYLCDLKPGDSVQVIGPFGSSFLMPNHAGSHLVMICTGTGSAPMRGMTEWRRRLKANGTYEGGQLVLFFGARTQQELPYFGPLQKLPKDFIDIHFAYSRTPGQPKRYVQDAMRDAAPQLATLLQDPQTHFYVCGLKAMEEGVLQALQDIAVGAGMDWASVAATLRQEGRLQLETY